MISYRKLNSRGPFAHVNNNQKFHIYLRRQRFQILVKLLLFKTNFRFCISTKLFLRHKNKGAALKPSLEWQNYMDHFGKMGGTFQKEGQICLS